MKKILIADDHEVVRKGFKYILSKMQDNIEFDEAVNGQDVLEKVWTDDYDAVLLDVVMPGRNGLDILKQLRKEKPNLPVLMISGYSEERYAIRAVKDGANGYLLKTAASEKLIDAINNILDGKKYISASLAQKLADHVSTRNEKPAHESLSDREYQIFLMIASGKTTKEISDGLNISKQSTATYRSRILQKMKMKNNSQLMRYAIRNQLID